MVFKSILWDSQGLYIYIYIYICMYIYIYICTCCTPNETHIKSTMFWKHVGPLNRRRLFEMGCQRQSNWSWMVSSAPLVKLWHHFLKPMRNDLSKRISARTWDLLIWPNLFLTSGFGVMKNLNIPGFFLGDPCASKVVPRPLCNPTWAGATPQSPERGVVAMGCSSAHVEQPRAYQVSILDSWPHGRSKCTLCGVLGAGFPFALLRETGCQEPWENNTLVVAYGWCESFQNAEGLGLQPFKCNQERSIDWHQDPVPTLPG